MKTYRAIPHFYDDENLHLAGLGDDVSYLFSTLRKPPRDVLMLACGTGRAAIPVAREGHRVLGVDLDPAMLDLAEQKRDELAIDAKRLRFRQGDLLDFHVSERFDHAAILFNSFLVFTTLEQQDRVLKNVHRHLRRGGTLLIDIFNPDSAAISDDADRNADIRIFHSHALKTTVQRVVHVFATDRSQVRQTVFQYAWIDAEGKRRFKRIEFELTYHHERGLRMLLERNGFEVLSMAGDYDGSAVTVRSPRITAVARRH